jgi:hypothetical protein
MVEATTLSLFSIRNKPAGCHFFSFLKSAELSPDVLSRCHATGMEARRKLFLAADEIEDAESF